MRKRLTALTLTLCLALGVLPARGAASPFLDVPAGAWYAPGLEQVCGAGLMSGVGGGNFAPQATLTYGELYTVFARLLRYFHIGDAKLLPAPDDFWTQARDGVRLRDTMPTWVLDACWYLTETAGVTLPADQVWAERDHLGAPAAREDLARLLWDSVELAQGLKAAGTVLAYTPDVTEKNVLAYLPDTGLESALTLCRMGVLTGVDDRGTFDGEKSLTRAELSTALARIINPGFRVSYTLEAHLDWDNFYLTPVTTPPGYRVIWPADPDPTCYFSDGLYLHMDNGIDLTDQLSWTGHREGILDLLGTWALEPVWHTVSQVDQNGMADVVTAWPALVPKQVLVKKLSTPVAVGSLTPYQDSYTGLWGFQDPTETVVIPARYQVGDINALDTPFPFQFINGYAVVGQAQAGGGALCGLIDEAGAEVLPCVYDSLGMASDGLIYYRRGSEAGYYDLTEGRTAFTFPYTGGENRDNPFSEGLVPFAAEEGGIGYLDSAGDLVIPDLFDHAGPVLGGIALVSLGGRPYQLTLKY